MSSNNNFVAIVTGASRGLGAEIVLALAGNGYSVIAASRSGTLPTNIPQDLSEKIRAIVLDVSDYVSVKKAAEKVRSEYGRVSVLVNAAGVFGPIDLIHKTDPVAWAQTVMIDAIAPYFTIHEFLPGMLESGWGRIINVGSAASLHNPGPLNSAYGTAKVALNQLTRHVAAEISGTGVTANVIHPGDVKTQMWADIKEKALLLGEVGAAYTGWVDWVEQTGGDDPKKAPQLILELIGPGSESVNGTFAWIKDPLQAPIASWSDPVDEKPWS